MRQEGNVIYADEGMVFKRKNSNEIYGNEIYLGKSYYLDGVLLPEPHDDVPSDFEEIPDMGERMPHDGEITDTEALQIITEGE